MTSVSRLYITLHTHRLHQRRLGVGNKHEHVGIKTELVNPAVNVWRHIDAWTTHTDTHDNTTS